MAVRNNNIINIYNLFCAMDLAATINNNAESTNKIKSNISKSDFPNIYNQDFNVNIKQNHLRKLKAAFNILKNKYTEIEYLIEDNWRLINKFFKCNEKHFILLINLLDYLRAIHIYQALLVT